MLFPLQQTNNLTLGDNGVYLAAGAGTDYSEGEEAEGYLRKVFTESNDLSSNSLELENSIKDWSSEYHLTACRTNIVRCLNLSSLNNVLELGCGCGAITRYLGECGLHVDGVEGGTARAHLAALRCRDLDNVNIVRANFNELQLPEKSYDAVFMIGVIEYAAMFSAEGKGDRAAVAEIFARVRSSLTDGGVIIMALENRMGLKYLYGAGEDHLNIPYAGVYDYPGETGVHTYSRREWERILKVSGLDHYSFFFPFPDYKLPHVILGEDFVRHDPYAHSLLYRQESRDYLSDWSPAAHEFLSWKGVHRAGLLPELANSFLIVASENKNSVCRCSDRDFVHFSGMARHPSMRTVTSKITGTAQVVKERILPEDITATDPAMGQDLSPSPYHRGELLVTSWIESLIGGAGMAELIRLVRAYYSFIEKSCATVDHTGKLVDLLPSNIIVDPDSGNWFIFDLEWAAEKEVIGADYILFRALFWFGLHNKKAIAAAGAEDNIATVEEFVDLFFRDLGLSYERSRASFIVLEEQLHRVVAGETGRGVDVSFLLATPIGVKDRGPEIHDPGLQKKKEHREITAEFLMAGAKRALKAVESHFLSLHCLKIRLSRLFDAGFYRSSDKSLADLAVDPLLHYVKIGYREGRDPSPFFSLSYYKKYYPELVERGEDPLLHYIEKGWQEGAVTHPLLTAYRLEPGSLFRKMQLVKRETSSGHVCDVDPYFDPEYYCRRYRDVKESGLLPVVHYLRHGGRERRQPGAFFDPQWYVDVTPYYNQGNVDLLDHYLNTGAGVGKSPVPVFSPSYYREKTPDISSEETDLFSHYYRHGIKDDQAPCAWFDPVWYRRFHPDLRPYSFPLDHYLYQGVHEAGTYVNELVASLPNKPIISVLVPVYNVTEAYLNCCVRSVLYQSYPHWELCLVDDGSEHGHIRPLLEKWSAKDKRIRVKFNKSNQGIAITSNIAAAMATGDFLTFLDNDDELHPDALYRVVKHICTTGADLFYSDEELIGDDGRSHSVFFKPDFNRELLLCHNYITHMVVAEKSLFTAAGGFNPSRSGAQDYDLFLKMSEKARSIKHIPEVLYRWRASESSTSINHGQKLYADQAGREALADTLVRRGLRAEALNSAHKFYYRVKRQIDHSLKVSVLIPGRDGSDLGRFLEDLVPGTAYQNIEYLLWIDSEQTDIVGEIIKKFKENIRISLVVVAPGANRAKCYNEAAARACGEHVVFLDSSIQVKNNDWVEALLEYSASEGCALVGGHISEGPDDINFTVPDIENHSPLYYAEFLKKCTYYMNWIECSQNVSMVSCDFAMISRRIFLESGGFDEEGCSDTFMDCDLGLRLRSKGYDHVYTPYAKALRTEPGHKIDNIEDTAGDLVEKRLFQRRWHSFLVDGDPFYNPEVVTGSGLEKNDFMMWHIGDQP